MKTSKLGLLIFVVSLCAPAAFAQTAKGLKYVPQAVKGVKAVPYVVSPKVSPALRTNLAMPVVRPNVAAQVAPAVERAVAAKVTVQERLARLERNLNVLEEYARTHGNYLPPAENLRKEVNGDIVLLRRNYSLVNVEPFVERYENLKSSYLQQLQADYERLAHPYRRPIVVKDFRQRFIEQEQQKRQEQFVEEFRAQEQREILRQEKELLRQEKAWANLIAEEQQYTEAEEATDANASTVATKAEDNLPLEGDVVTDEYVDQLLRFYNKLDPLGTGTIQ